MTMQMIKNVCLNPTTANMTKIKITISTVTLTELLRQAMPFQGLLGTKKMPAFMHVVLASKGSVFQMRL